MADLYQSFVEVFHSLAALVGALGALLAGLIHVLLTGGLLLGWAAWWLWGVNWAKAWPVLAQGAWVPLLLLIALGALVWSQILPGGVNLGFATLPNFWWHLGAAGLLAGTALFCGWLQGYMGWTPEEIPIYPEGGHGHDDAHGHSH